MTSDPVSHEDRDALAAELALGLLEGDERAAAVRMYLAEPNFAASVEEWRIRLTPLFDEIGDVPAPAHIWPIIEARTGGKGAAQVVRRLNFWRGAAVGSSAIAATLALFMILPATVPEPELPPPVVVAQLVGEGETVLAASYDASQGSLRFGAGTIISGSKSPELWVIPKDGVPRSLGLIDPSAGRSLILSPTDRKWMTEGATLAVTLEESASAPHAAPSSAPILAGKIFTI